jgi:hypothetical protein
MDSRLVFWDNQSLTTAEESRTNGNSFNMESGGATDPHLGNVWLNIIVGTAFAGLDSGGYFELLTSDSETFASGVRCPASIGSEDNPLTAAQLAANARFSVGVPTFTLHGHIEVNFNVVNEAASAGAVDAWLGLEPLSDLNIQKEPT